MPRYLRPAGRRWETLLAGVLQGLNGRARGCGGRGRRAPLGRAGNPGRPVSTETVRRWAQASCRRRDGFAHAFTARHELCRLSLCRHGPAQMLAPPCPK